MTESNHVDRSSEQTEIDLLNQTILLLTAELQELRLEVNSLRRQSVEGEGRAGLQPRASTTRRSRPPTEREGASDYFAIDDIVEITNSRGGLRGVRGRVVNVTRTQVHILSDQYAGIIRRKYTNVRLIQSTADHSEEATANRTISDLEQ